MNIVVISNCTGKPMNAFSPNGDGINDRWIVTNGPCFVKAKVQVFNRFGSKIFDNTDYKNNWEGTFNGKPLPDGTYYYTVTFLLINGSVETQSGNVTIVR
jgi:gliding motility-associated-like protein